MYLNIDLFLSLPSIILLVLRQWLHKQPQALVLLHPLELAPEQEQLVLQVRAVYVFIVDVVDDLWRRHDSVCMIAHM